MKTDQFTKIVLTIIALNLSFISFKNYDIVPKAYANSTINEVATGKNYGLVPINEDGSINVKFNATDEINVNITGINTFDELDVNIEEISGRSIFGNCIPVKFESDITSEPIPVSIKEISNLNPLPVNIEKINDYSIRGSEIPIRNNE